MKVVRVFSSDCHCLVSIVWTHNARDFLLFAKSRSTVYLMPLNKTYTSCTDTFTTSVWGCSCPPQSYSYCYSTVKGHTQVHIHTIHWKWLKSQSECMDTTCEYCHAVLIETTAVPSTQYQCITVILQLERSTEEKHPVHTWGRLTWREGTVTAQTQTKISHFR